MKKYGRTAQTIVAVVAGALFIILGVSIPIHFGLKQFIQSEHDRSAASRTTDPGKDKALRTIENLNKMKGVESAELLYSFYDSAKILVTINSRYSIREKVNTTCKEGAKQAFAFEPYEIICEISSSGTKTNVLEQLF